MITSGSSVLETATLLRQHGLVVDRAVVFLDREQGGQAILSEAGVKAECVTNISTLMTTLLKHGRINQSTVDQVAEFLNNNKVKAKTPGELLSNYSRPCLHYHSPSIILLCDSLLRLVLYRWLKIRERHIVSLPFYLFHCRNDKFYV